VLNRGERERALLNYILPVLPLSEGKRAGSMTSSERFVCALKRPCAMTSSTRNGAMRANREKGSQKGSLARFDVTTGIRWVCPAVWMLRDVSDGCDKVCFRRHGD
jgi:hypothetical protein